jgi:hypothetical protein
VNGRRAGGRIRRGTPGTDNAYVDLAEAANQEPGFTLPAAGGFVYVWLLFPHGLPRWAMYAPAPAARVPRSPRGILTMSTLGPTHGTGQPVAGILPPAVTGLTAFATTGLLIAALTTDAGPNYSSFSSSDRGRIFMPDVPHIVAVGANTTTEQNFSLTAGTDYPANARAIFASLRIIYGGVETADNGFIVVRDGGNGVNLAVLATHGGYANTNHFITEMEIPVPNYYPVGAPSTPTCRIAWVHSATGAPAISAQLHVRGWVL